MPVSAKRRWLKSALLIWSNTIWVSRRSACSITFIFFRRDAPCTVELQRRASRIQVQLNAVQLRDQSTVCMAVPTHCVRMLAEPALDAEACRNMRLFMSGPRRCCRAYFRHSNSAQAT